MVKYLCWVSDENIVVLKDWSLDLEEHKLAEYVHAIIGECLTKATLFVKFEAKSWSMKA